MAQEALRLQEGEEVVTDVLPSKWWTLSRYICTLGLWAIWRTRHRWVLTNHRLLALRGVIGKHEQALPLERIQDVSTQASPFSGGSIRLSTAGGQLGFTSIGPLTRADAYRFADAIIAQQQKKAAEQKASNTAPVIGGV